MDPLETRENLFRLPRLQRITALLDQADFIACTGLFDYLADADAVALLQACLSGDPERAALHQAIASASADAEPADWTRAAVMTAVANLLAGLALGGSLWWHRRRTRRVLLGCEAALAPAG